MEILGAYKIEVSDEELERFLDEVYGEAQDPRERQEQLDMKREELGSVVGFDIRVTDADGKFDAGHFTQSGTDQVAYNEVYLSADGQSVEGERRPKDPANFRIYFFLHFVELEKPLLTSYGELTIPELTPLPEDLHKIHPFEPAD